MSVTSTGTKNEPIYASSGNPPTFAADLTAAAAYAAEYGNLKVGTTTQKNAFTAWEGLVWYDTTLNRLYVHDGSGWVTLYEDTGWIAPTLLNTWANFGSGFRNAAYRRHNGVVEFRGTIKNGSTAVFTLPSGFRPAAIENFPIQTNVGGGELRVDTAGAVTIPAYWGGGGNGIVALTTVRFVADGS